MLNRYLYGCKCIYMDVNSHLDIGMHMYVCCCLHVSRLKMLDNNTAYWDSAANETSTEGQGEVWLLWTKLTTFPSAPIYMWSSCRSHFCPCWMSLTSVPGHLLAAKTPMQSYFIARFQEGCTLWASHSDLWNYQTEDIVRFTRTPKHWKTPLLWILDYFRPIQRLGGQNFQAGLLLHSGPIYSFLFARAQAQENVFLLKRNKTSLFTSCLVTVTASASRFHLAKSSTVIWEIRNSELGLWQTN